MLSKEEHYQLEKQLNDIELPPGLDVLLAHRISEKFRKAGIYFHLFRRYKTIDSILHKFDTKSYNRRKKIQDLVGLKYVFYFVDDLEKAKEIIETEYELDNGKWESTEKTANEFSATKINGVFRIPKGTIPKKTCEAMRKCLIDTTFEIQLKTMLFQSWHETDHDLRYKNRELWDLLPEMDRKLNRILAILELCDSSVISVFDKLTEKTLLLIKKMYSNGQYNPVFLEKIAQIHFRIHLEAQDRFPLIRDEHDSIPAYSLTDKGEDIDITKLDNIYNPADCRGIMKKHFSDAFEYMKLKDYENKAEYFTSFFLTIDFLETLASYKRSELIDGFLGYENDIPITIFNICALIYTQTMAEKSQSDQLVQLLKRYLRKQHHPHNQFQKSEQQAEKNNDSEPKTEKSQDEGAQPDQYQNKISYIRKYKKYATYQCHCDIFPKDPNTSISVCFKKTLSEALTWLCSRLTYNESQKENAPLKQLMKLAENMTDPNYPLESQRIRVTECYDLSFIYVESENNAAIRITEPDKKYESNFGEEEISTFMENRTFITDIGIRESKKQGEHVELAVRCSCKEPVSNSIDASAFRPAFVRTILDNTTDFIVTEHGIRKEYCWKHKEQEVFKIKQRKELDDFRNDKSRQLPLVILPKKALDDPDFESKFLARSLTGYGHIIADMNDDGKNVHINYKSKKKEEEIQPDILDGKSRYVYTRQKIYDKIKNYTVKKKLKFGDVKFYPELKEKYYRDCDHHDIEELKKKIKELEKQLKEQQKKSGSRK